MSELRNINITALRNFIKTHKSTLNKGLDFKNVMASAKEVMTFNQMYASRKPSSLANEIDFSGLVNDLKFDERGFTGSQIIDIVEDVERTTQKYGKSFKNVSEVIQSVTTGLGLSMKDSAKVIETTHFSKMGKDLIKSYMNSFDDALGFLEGKDPKRIQIDPEHLGPMAREVEQSYERMLSYIAVLEAGQLNADRKMGNDDRNLYDAVLFKIKKEEGAFKLIQSKLKESTSASATMKKTAFERAEEMSDFFNDKLNRFEGMFRALKKGDFSRSFLNIKGLFSPNKEAASLNKAQANIEKETGKLGKVLSTCIFLEVISKTIKQVLGGLFGLNDHAASFNEELQKHHGMLSAGVTVNLEMSNPKAVGDKYQQYQDLMSDYGWDTKTFISKEDIFVLTDAFEKQGGRLTDIAASKKELGPYLDVALKARYGLGLSMEESSDMIATWKHQFGMGLDEISETVGYLGEAQKATGYPVRSFLETMNNTNSDYGMTADRFKTVIDLQKLGLEKGRLTAKTNVESVNTLLAHLKGMDSGHWAKLTEPLVQTGRYSEFISYETDRYDQIAKTATNETQKTQALISKRVLQQSLKEDPYFQRRILKEHASEETLLKIYTESMKAHLGSEFKDQLGKGVLTENMEVTFRALLGFAGDRKTIEQFKEATYVVMDSPELFAKHDIHKKLSDAFGVNKKSHKGMGAGIKNAIQQSTTSSQMKAAFYTKWMNKIMQSLRNSTIQLSDFWAIKLFGSLMGGANRADVVQAMNDIRTLSDRIDKEKDVKKKEALLKILQKRAQGLKDSGADMYAVMIELGDKTLPKEVFEVLKSFAPTSGRNFGGGDVLGGGGGDNLANIAKKFVSSGEADKFAFSNEQFNGFVTSALYRQGVACAQTVEYIVRKAGARKEVLEAMNASAPGTYDNLLKAGFAEAVPESSIQAGDLIFADEGDGIHHIGIYVGNGQVVDAENGAGYQIGTGQRTVLASNWMKGRAKYLRFKKKAFDDADLSSKEVKELNKTLDDSPISREEANKAKNMVLPKTETPKTVPQKTNQETPKDSKKTPMQVSYNTSINNSIKGRFPGATPGLRNKLMEKYA